MNSNSFFKLLNIFTFAKNIINKSQHPESIVTVPLPSLGLDFLFYFFDCQRNFLPFSFQVEIRIWTPGGDIDVQFPMLCSECTMDYGSYPKSQNIEYHQGGTVSLADFEFDKPFPVN